MSRKHVNFPVTEEEHRQLKMLAAKEGKSMKELLLEALEKLFPNWKKSE
ncbi:MAG: hypothetical protein RRY29_07720 [Desulfovibrionaceae bacterium]